MGDKEREWRFGVMVTCSLYGADQHVDDFEKRLERELRVKFGDHIDEVKTQWVTHSA